LSGFKSALWIKAIVKKRVIYNYLRAQRVNNVEYRVSSERRMMKGNPKTKVLIESHSNSILFQFDFFSSFFFLSFFLCSRIEIR